MENSEEKRIIQAGKSLKKGVKNLGYTINNAVAGVGNILTAGYQAIDAGDKAIGKGIEKGMEKKGKDTTGKVKKFFRNNIMKILLGTSVLTYGGVEGYQYIKEQKEENTELSISEDEKTDIQSVVTEDLQYIEKGVRLLRDGPLTFYVVQKGEGLIAIKNKLQEIPEFSYLSEPEYDVPSSGRNIKGFNTPSSSLTPGFYLPVPMKAADREIEIANFKNCARDAIKQMESNEHYGNQVKELLGKVDVKDVINIMTAFARCETACDQVQFSDPIGSVELHRREPKYRAYSFSYFHILMGKGPGITARKKLGLTEGDCYNATNACKLFLGYCFEKKPDNIAYFFKINSLESAKNVGKTYNGKRAYGNKLRANIQHCKK